MPEYEMSWVEYMNENFPNRIEIHPIPMAVMVNKYGLNEEDTTEYALIHYKLYDDSPYYIDLIDLNENPDEVSSYTQLLIDATDIPGFVKTMKEWKDNK